MNLELVRAVNRVMTNSSKRLLDENIWGLLFQGPLGDERHILYASFSRFYSINDSKNNHLYHSLLGPALIEENKIYYYIDGILFSKDAWLLRKEIILNEYRTGKSIQQGTEQ